MSIARNILAVFFALPAYVFHKTIPSIRVLMYHRVCSSDVFEQLTVTPERFAQQLEALHREGNVISLAQASALLKSNERLDNGKIVITFDDGYTDNLIEALPLLEKYNIPATIFVTTDFCSQKYTHPRYREQSDMGDNSLHLNWNQVRTLSEHPLITIGSHTLSHASLQRVSAEQAQAEILDSKLEIEQQLGKEVDFFCYPNGDFGHRELSIVAASSYKAAVSVSPGVNTGHAQLHELRRTEVTDKDGSFSFALKLIGAFDVMHRLLHVRRKANFSRAAIFQQTAKDSETKGGI